MIGAALLLLATIATPVGTEAELANTKSVYQETSAADFILRECARGSERSAYLRESKRFARAIGLLDKRLGSEEVRLHWEGGIRSWPNDEPPDCRVEYQRSQTLKEYQGWVDDLIDFGGGA